MVKVTPRFAFAQPAAANSNPRRSPAVMLKFTRLAAKSAISFVWIAVKILISKSRKNWRREVSVVAQDWYRLSEAFGILADAETFVLLLEGAFNEKKREDRTAIAETLFKTTGIAQLKKLAVFEQDPRGSDALVISFVQRKF